MNNDACIAWVNRAFQLTDNHKIVEALTHNLDWLLGLEPDIGDVRYIDSCLPPMAALGIYLGAEAMSRCGDAFRAPFWLEEAIIAYHAVYPNAEGGTWRGNSPLWLAEYRYRLLNKARYDAAWANEAWQQASLLLERLWRLEDELHEGRNHETLKGVIADEHPLGPFYYDNAWLLTQQERLINANVLDERCESTWEQYARHLRHLLDVGRVEDAVIFSRLKLAAVIHLEDNAEFSLSAIAAFSCAGRIDEAISAIEVLNQYGKFNLARFCTLDKAKYELTPENFSRMKNLLESPAFSALLARRVTPESAENNDAIFKSLNEKMLGGKTSKRCALSQQKIAPGEPIYQYRMLDGVEYIADKAAFEASELYIVAQQQINESCCWQNFTCYFDHPDIHRFIRQCCDNPYFNASAFIHLIANPLVYPMRFQWIAGPEYEKRYPAHAFFVNDDLAGEFVNLCWAAMQCGHVGDVFAQLAQEQQDIADPIYAMLATFDRMDCRQAAATHFNCPDLPEIMAKAFSARLSLDNLLAVADFGRSQPRFAQALAVALARYNLHLYSNYHPQVDWQLRGLEHYSRGKCGQLLYFFIHIPDLVPVLADMLVRGVLVDGVSTSGYDGYNNTGNHFYHAAVIHCALHAPDKLSHWLDLPWKWRFLLNAPLRETLRHVAACQKRLMKAKARG